MTSRSTRRFLLTSLAALSLTALRCNVYDASLLGNGQSAVGGTAGRAHSGGPGSSAAGSAIGHGGSAGGFEANSGSTNAGLGGLAEMAGATLVGGAETSGGSAGTAGLGGSVGGTAGSGNTVGSGGTAGFGGAAGAGGAGGGSQAVSGCAKLSVVLDDAGDKAHFALSLASTADLSSATISMRFYVQAGQGGTIFNYVQDSGTYHFLGVPTANRQALGSANGWMTVSWDVGAELDSAGTGIVKSSIKTIGIEINAQPSSTWSNPTIVYVDSLTVQSPALSFTFDASSSVSTNNVAGALWLNGNSMDTTASGSTVSWQAACP